MSTKNKTFKTSQTALVIFLLLQSSFTFAAEIKRKSSDKIEFGQFIHSAENEESKLLRDFKNSLPQEKPKKVDVEVIDFYDAEIRWKKSVNSAKK